MNSSPASSLTSSITSIGTISSLLNSVRERTLIASGIVRHCSHSLHEQHYHVATIPVLVVVQHQKNRPSGGLGLAFYALSKTIRLVSVSLVL